ncbi:MAG TPA: hypothetical protein DCS48_05865 [Desulfovibrio sp.]|nr:hypothetical protein [Desulfovibrio sp.]
MIPIAAITTFLGTGKGKLIIGLALAGLMAAGFLIWIAFLKGDIADLRGELSKRDTEIARLDKKISALKLEIRSGEIEIEKLSESVANSENAVVALRGQVADEKKALRQYQIDLNEAQQLLAKAENEPITNSTGVLSHEDSVRVVDHYNEFWGLCPENAARPH